MSGVSTPNWPLVPLGDLGEIRLGKMLDKSKNQGSQVQYLRNVNVRWFQFDLSDLQSLRVSDSERELLSVRDGDLFICEGGEPGRCAVWQGGANSLVYQKALHRFRAAAGITPKFLMYRLRHDAGNGTLKDTFTGTTIKHLTRESLFGFEIPVPPLNEQKRIADKLDTVLARVDACRDRLDRIPAILKRFRQSVLAAATSGKLTEDWREKNTVSVDAQALLARIRQEKKERASEHFFRKQPTVNTLSEDDYPWELPRSWAWARSSEVFLKITDGAHSTPKVLNEGWPYLTAKDITTGRLDFSSKQFISEKDHRELYLKCRPEPYDLLVTNIGASSGCVALVDVQFEFSFKNIAILKPSNEMNSKYLWFHQVARRDAIFSDLTKGGAQPFLSLEVLGDLIVAVPPRNEQTEIVRRVETLFAYADRLEASYKAARTQVEKLTPATLAKAFRGELVPQDPNDEPASALLARIRAQRGEQTKPKRGRKAITA